jgi:hypothetical protein
MGAAVVLVVVGWAAHVGPFDSSPSVGALVAIREDARSASCHSVGEIEANGHAQRVFRCQVTGGKSGAYASGCYWIEHERAIKLMVALEDFGC